MITPKMPNTWGFFHRQAINAGMSDDAACIHADAAMREIEQQDREDVRRETMNREPGQD